MDREFMENYFDTMYSEFEDVILETNSDYAAEVKAGRRLQAKFSQIYGTNSDVWKLHIAIVDSYLHQAEIIKREAYLQGAEDRERMLR